MAPCCGLLLFVDMTEKIPTISIIRKTAFKRNPFNSIIVTIGSQVSKESVKQVPEANRAFFALCYEALPCALHSKLRPLLNRRNIFLTFLSSFYHFYLSTSSNVERDGTNTTENPFLLPCSNRALPISQSEESIYQFRVPLEGEAIPMRLTCLLVSSYHRRSNTLHSLYYICQWSLYRYLFPYQYNQQTAIRFPV